MKRQSHFLAILFAIAVLVATAADGKRLTIYTPDGTYAIAVVDRDGREYVSLLDVLTPLGTARSHPDGDKWKLRFNDTESEFKIKKSKAKVNRKDVDLSAPFLVDSGRGLVPVHSLSALLPRLLGIMVDVREPARRVFVGIPPTQFTAELQKNAPPKLILHFSAPVNPSTATEPGTLRMTFTREPLVAGVATRTFDDKTIKAASFVERDGVAELTIQGSAPLLATFSDQNRTITIAPAPQAAASPTAPPPPATPSPQQAPQAAPASPAAPVTHARATVVIDPGHGGDDRGAALSATLAEKDVTLTWARRLRAALEQKGMSSMLLRDGDTSLTFDQRAALANAARPLVFITLHAGNTGTGVRVYTAHLGETAPRAGSFLPWDSAQAAFLDGSRALAGSVAAEMNKRQIPAGTAPVLVRPLSNMASSAVAIEVMPPTAAVAGLMSVGYQQSVCAAIADGIAASKANAR